MAGLSRYSLRCIMWKSALALFVFGFSLSCAADPSLYVHRMKLGRKAPREEGDVLKVQRPDTERFGTAQPGFFALKTREEWTKFWEGTGSNPEPPQLDFERKMILVAVTESAQSQALHIDQVVETGTSVHVYVTETRPGEGCPMRTGGVPKQDFIAVDHSTKPVHFHVEPVQATTCGDAPTAVVQCKVEGAGGAAPEVMAMPGQTIECEAQQQVRGVFAAVDRRWNFSEFPHGSTSKLTFDPNGMRVKFTVDTYGRYAVHFEVVDDAGRKGESSAAVVSTPSKDGLYVRLGWGGFESGDDPETFPRVNLEAAGSAPTAGLCTVEGARPGWCDAKRQGHNIQLKLNATDGTFPLTVKYTDDRFSGAPMVCIKVFASGAQTADLCDKDPRKAGEVWKVGALLAKSGLIQPITDEPKPVDPVPTATATAKPPVKPPVGTGKPPVGTGKPPVGTGKKPKGTGIFNP
jgi:hypothetical protein